MTNAQTESRALLETAGARFPDYEEYDAAVALIATALAAKDAATETQAKLYRQALKRAKRAEAQLAEANKALEPFARFAAVGDVSTMKLLGMKPDAYHIGDSDTVATGGRRDHDSYRKITWGDIRAARRAREAQGGE